LLIVLVINWWGVEYERTAVSLCQAVVTAFGTRCKEGLSRLVKAYGVGIIALWLGEKWVCLNHRFFRSWGLCLAHGYKAKWKARLIIIS
jgi:hypothetical protein